MYKTLNDAAAAQGINELRKGNTKIWYVKSEYFRNFLFGITSAKEHLSKQNIEFGLAMIQKTHTLIGEIACTNLDDIFVIMQGEQWSPIGEGAFVIQSNNASHTSMTVGDIIQIEDKAFIVDSMGFVELF